MESLISERRKKKSKNSKTKLKKDRSVRKREVEEKSRAKPEKSSVVSMRKQAKRPPFSREKPEKTAISPGVTPPGGVTPPAGVTPPNGSTNYGDIFDPAAFSFNIEKICNPEPENHVAGQNSAFEAIATQVIAAGTDGLVKEYGEQLAGFLPVGHYDRIIFDANTELKKNRYKDVVCNDKTRVILHDGRPGDYIHANYVRGTRPGYILTQGPLKDSLFDFWRMVVQEQVSVICMLCELIENGKTKCEPYFPMQPGESMTFGDISVTCEEIAKPDRHTHLKVFNVLDKLTGKAGKVTHFKIVTWPDKTVALSNLSILRTHRTLRKFVGNVVIHCSAGVGRTGTFAAIEIGIQLLLNGKTFKLCDLVKCLRHCRMTSVQMETQYLMLAESLLECGSVFKYIEDPKLLEGVESFKKQVAEYVEAHPPPHEKGKVQMQLPSREEPSNARYSAERITMALSPTRASAEKATPSRPNTLPNTLPSRGARALTPPRRAAFGMKKVPSTTVTSPSPSLTNVNQSEPNKE